MNLERLTAYARRPAGLIVKLRMDLHNALHPGEPWFAPGAIRFCDRTLTKDMRALEWGSGRSTLWFAKRVGSITSVEHQPDWHARVTKMVGDAGATNVDLRLVELPSDPDELNALYWKNSRYVSIVEELADESLNFVVVDGLFRQECVARVLPKVAAGGYVLVDDTAHLPSLDQWGFPPTWRIVHRSRFLVAETTVWRKPA